MKTLSYLSFLRNKFLIAALLFATWIIFFDKNDLFVQSKRKADLRQLQESKLYFQNEIEKEKQFSSDLKNNPAMIEKFAREKYLMKKENEDLFIIQPPVTNESQ